MKNPPKMPDPTDPNEELATIGDLKRLEADLNDRIDRLAKPTPKKFPWQK